jgi:tetratricopeptide (TPR) repeat protein
LSAAAAYAQAGLDLAREKGILPLQPYLLSTLGEIALAGGDWAMAKRLFEEGLALAERLSMPERIAGLTANLGLAARRQGQPDLAIHRLSTALAAAESLGIQHLAVQIHLWLVPLLPPDEARRHLAEAIAIAESSGRRGLLEEAGRLESALCEPGQA